MSFRLTAIAVSALLAMSLAGCETSEQNQRAGTGALLAGQALGHNTKSTVIGAAGGALLGAAVGTATTPSGGGNGNQNLCRYQRPDGSIYNAPCEGNGGRGAAYGGYNNNGYNNGGY